MKFIDFINKMYFIFTCSYAPKELKTRSNEFDEQFGATIL